MTDLRKELDALGTNYRAMLESPLARLDDARHDLLKYLAEKRIPGIVILFTMPVSAARAHLARLGIDAVRIFFIDCVTPGHAREDNVTYIGETSLTDIAIAVGQFAETIPGEKFLLMDAVNTLLIEHDEKTAAKFVNAITARATMLAMDAVFIVVKGKDPGLYQSIYPFFDKVIDYG